MVGVPGDQAVAADPVDRLDALDHLHGEGQPGHPGTAGLFVGDVEARRRRVRDPCLRAQVVAGPDQQVGLAAAHQVHVPERDGGLRGERRGPDQARRPGAEQVDHLDGAELVGRGKDRHQVRCRPAVARLVEPHGDAAGADVQQVRGPGPVDVGQADPARVEQVVAVEPRRPVHGDLGAEPPVADAGPVARLAVAHPDDIGQAVPGHVGGEDRLRAVREDDRRAFLLVPRGAHLLRGREAGLAQRRVHRVQAVLGHEDVREAVAGHVDEPDVRVRPVQRRQRGEPAAAARSPRPAVRSKKPASGSASDTTSRRPLADRSISRTPDRSLREGKAGDGLQRAETRPRGGRAVRLRDKVPALRFRL